MRKWLYLLPPVAGLGLFVVIYLGDIKKRDEREAVHKVEADRKKAEDDQKKKDAEAASAKAMADKEQSKREADAKKKKDREDADAAKKRQVADDTKAARDMIAAQNRRIASIERDISDLNSQRTKAYNEYLAALQVVEGLKEERRKAELAAEDAIAKLPTQLADNPMESFPDGYVPGRGFPQTGFPRGGRGGGGGGGRGGP